MASNLLDKKLEYWEHQLLDLSKRNKMINYRETKRTTLKLLEPSFVELFNRIALNEETLTFQRAVDRETDIRVFSMLSLLEHLSTSLPVTIGDIKTEGSILERQRTLKNLRSKARLSLEEQGTNILYLSFGFIEWKDSKGASAQWIKSPLILVPAVLAIEALNSPYTLSKHEDDIVVNPTLEYYLKTEYGIELPNFDVDKDTLEGYLESLEEVADQRGWRIIKEVSLGLLSFLKISMYNDLLRNEERIKNNPVIRAMFVNADEANDISDELRTFNLDSIKTQDCYQVMSADSSQQDAILYSKNNISFVMQGPPGTGKSQTITNIIAEALAEGKKVLFVSEKMAALQVVYKRMQDANLADFCLPLHSYKANKKQILEQVGANLKLKQTRVKDTAITNLEELLSIRQELNKYADELHTLNPELNISCYEVYSKLEEVNDAESIYFGLDNVLGVSQSELQLYLNKIKEYALALHRLNYYIKNNPWEGISSRMSGYEYSDKMRFELSSFSQILSRLNDILCQIQESQSIATSIQYGSLEELAALFAEVSKLPQVPEDWLESRNLNDSIALAKEAKENYSKLFSLKQEIAEVFTDEIFNYDYNGWKDKLLAKANGFVDLHLIKEKSGDFYIKNASTITNTFNTLKKYFEIVFELFGNINSLLGTSFVTNEVNQQVVATLVKIMQENIPLNKKWFELETEKVKAIIKEAQTVQNQVDEQKQKILSNWEAEILELDYDPILLRYKTDYTSFFKIFNSQYKRDKKQIQVLSKTVIKKLSDEAAVDLLNDLKVYHDKVAWFDEMDTALRDSIGDSFTGIYSDWNLITKAIINVEKLRELPFEIPERLIDIVSKSHIESTQKLSSYLEKIISILSQAKEIIDNNKLDINIASTEFDVQYYMDLLDKYIIGFDSLITQSNLLMPYLLNGDEQIEKVYAAIENLNEYKDLADKIAVATGEYQKQYGFYFDSQKTDWVYLISVLNETNSIKQTAIYSFVKPLINVTDERKAELNEISSQLTKAYNEGSNALEWIQNQFSAQVCLAELEFNAIVNKINSCLNNIELLEKWIDYQEAKDDCNCNGLSDFISKIESEEHFKDIEKCFLKGFYHMWLGAVCDKSASVRRFRRNIHDERIKKFIELDDLQLLIAQMRIREKLIENLPSTHRMLKATDEVAILNKELSKKRNIMPLRKLFKLIPNLLMNLKPCLMMSPLSVSYFLETEAYHFDLVIFDEASQIFPEDAVGAIFRGFQVVIAGDSKQLPPTNFFAVTTNNFDGDYDIEGEEDYSDVVSDSILEESASVLPNRTLLWHYRSKNESLIAFSNREIYKNNLITFPNSITKMPDMGVEYIYVENGCYEGGGKNCNIREAEKCVMLVLEHIQKHPDRSLGIIAFSEKQQTAIENAIIDFRERMPQYEWFFDDTKDEPFFVKNLENVQGDERDTIIFSICYAKDKNGKMYMRFGPLGHEGGERRLNVAITRAKCNVKLVGSILPSDIDLGRTNSEGVRMLRSYIEFARKGEKALRPVEREEAFESTDDFCNMVAEFLRENGYKVKQQVGCSDYKIDMAVENPDVEGEYIAGIECDGLSYIQAKTARDRDHLRTTILQNMGWNLYRVWSTEWSRNTQAEKEALLDFIQSVVDKNGNVTHNVRQSNEESDKSLLESIASETVKTVQKVSGYNPYGFSYYKEANWWEATHTDSYDNLTRISENVLHIVSIEQPMHIELLYKRMGPSFTTGKATESVKNTIDEAIAERLKGRVVVDEDHFIRLFPLAPTTVRIPEQYATPRPIEYIHIEEIAAAMIEIVKNSFGITEEDLATECARAFGFERKGPKIKVRTDAAIKYLVDNEIIRIIDGKAQLRGE